MTARAADVVWPELDPHHGSQLQHGCEALGISLEPGQQERLLNYLELLRKWNKTYNLTAVREPAQMLTRHLLDSLAIAPLLPAGSCLDVGTGAGLPGVPLAILFSQRRFSLLDSNGKKTRFLFQVKTELCLDNISVHHARVESFEPPEPYDVVLSRAFASLGDMVSGCRHLLAPAGRFLAMKGAYPAAELEALGPAFADRTIHRLDVPGLAEQRHLVELIMHDFGRAP